MTFQEYWSQIELPIIETHSGKECPIPSKDQELLAEKIFEYIKEKFDLNPFYISPTVNGDIYIKYPYRDEKGFFMEVYDDLKYGGMVRDHSGKEALKTKVSQSFLINKDCSFFEDIDELVNIYFS